MSVGSKISRAWTYCARKYLRSASPAVMPSSRIGRSTVTKPDLLSSLTTYGSTVLSGVRPTNATMQSSARTAETIAASNQRLREASAEEYFSACQSFAVSKSSGSLGCAARADLEKGSFMEESLLAKADGRADAIARLADGVAKWAIAQLLR